MGFRKPDLGGARQAVQHCVAEIRSPYNDGWTAMACKHDLYLLRSYLNEAYAQLPKFSGEEKWEQELVIDRLKQK